MNKKVLECKHLSFVLDMKHFTDGYAINVFSRKKWKKIYKRKVRYIGCVAPIRNKEWIFVLDSNQEEGILTLSAETMAIIVFFITQLKRNKVKVNEEKGELELL